MTASLEDLRAALVRLRRRPASHLAAAAILALGLGAAMAMVMLLNAVVFHELPGVETPSRLVYMRQTRDVSVRDSTPIAAIPLLVDRQHSFTSMCGLSTGGLFRVERNGASSLNAVTLVTPACAGVLGIRPYLGRLIDANDDPAKGVSAVVVLSYGYWRRAFGADPHALGQRILIQGAPHTIVGVSQPGFKGIAAEVDSDIMVPINYNRLPPADPRRGLSANYVVGRLRSGVTIASAQAELDGVWSAVREATAPPATGLSDAVAARRNRLEVTSLATGISGIRTRFGTPLMLLSALAAALFLAASVNVAGLATAETTRRQTEFAVRAALGGSRARVRRQVAFESAVIVALAALAAIPAAVWIIRGVIAIVWSGLVPLALPFSPTLPVVVIGVALVAAAWILLTLLPARVAVAAFGHFGSRGVVTSARTRWSRLLLVGQVALSVGLAFGASLLARSLVRLEHIDVGFEIDHIALARAVAVPNGYANIDTRTYYTDLLTQTASMPGVTSSTLSHTFPSPLTSPETAFALAGTNPAQSPISLEMVAPRFFATMSVPLREGRDFTPGDNGDAPAVVIINESLARVLFPGRSAVGARMRIGSDPRRASLEVIGVVSDFRAGDFRLVPRPMAIRPFWQEPAVQQAPIVLVRTSGDPAASLHPLERAIASLKREYSPAAQTMASLLGSGLTQDRAMAGISVCFGALAVALSVIGIFAQLTLDVRRRAPELGVRIALGASARAIRRLVLRDASWVIGGGLLLGLPLALAAGRASRALLFEISPTDSIGLFSVGALVTVAGLAAASIPAIRASRMDPIEAVRSESARQ